MEDVNSLRVPKLQNTGTGGCSDSASKKEVIPSILNIQLNIGAFYPKDMKGYTQTKFHSISPKIRILS